MFALECRALLPWRNSSAAVVSRPVSSTFVRSVYSVLPPPLTSAFNITLYNKQDEEFSPILDTFSNLFNDVNPRVCQSALACAAGIVDASMENEAVHSVITSSLIPSLPTLLERLADSKSTIRDPALQLILSLTTLAGTAPILEQLRDGAAHKNPKVREQTLVTLIRVLDAFKVTSRECMGMMAPIAKAFEDATPEVRDSAAECIVAMYRCVRFRI